MSKTYYTILTGKSVSAIATFFLFGGDFQGIIKKIFIPKAGQLKEEIPMHGFIRYNNITYDEVIVRISKNTKVFPYIEHCEINIHGSIGILTALQTLFTTLEIKEVTPPAILLKALQERKIKYYEFELFNELFKTSSLKYTTLLLEEQKNPFLKTLSKNINDIDYLKKLTDQLLSKYAVIRKFKKPIKVAIFGGPNAGKSTLFNCLCNSQRAITSNLPGTTTDYISHIIYYKDFAIELIDTAGLWESDDFVNLKAKEITKKLWKNTNMYKLVIFSYDAPIPCELINSISCHPENILLVENKIDLQKPATLNNLNLPTIKISAHQKLNIDILFENIKKMIGLEQFENLSNPIIFTQRQKILLTKLIKAIENQEISKVKTIIGELENGKRIPSCKAS
jgi:tRNA modification GTPase